MTDSNSKPPLGRGPSRSGRGNGSSLLCLFFGLVIFGAALEYSSSRGNLDGLVSYLYQRVEIIRDLVDDASISSSDVIETKSKYAGYDEMNYVSNATVDFLEVVTDGNVRRMHNGAHPLLALSNASRAFLPAVVGE